MHPEDHLSCCWLRKYWLHFHSWSYEFHIFWEGYKILRNLGNLHRRFDRYYIGQIYSGDLLQKFASFSQYMNFNGLYFEIIFESVCIKIGSFFICRGSAATSGRTPMKNFNIGLLKPSILPPYLWYCPNHWLWILANLKFNFKNNADFSNSLDY